jgi:hypothetical protein
MNKEISYGSWEELDYLFFGFVDTREYYKKLNAELKKADPDGSKSMTLAKKYGAGQTDKT